MSAANKYLMNPKMHEPPGKHPDPQYIEWNEATLKTPDLLREVLEKINKN
jgi:hypothetical protein